MKILGLIVLLSAPLAAASASAPQAVAPAGKVVTAAQVNGTWVDGKNTFKVWALGRQRLKIEFLGTYEYKVRGEWMANSGGIDGTAFIEGDTATFTSGDSGDDCKITMRFTAGKMIVSQEGGCGFGAHVIADGTYRKKSARKPVFGGQ